MKVATTAPRETTRADEIAIETAKTGKVTVVVMVMSIFSEKRCKLRSANSRNEKLSCQKMEIAIFLEEIPADQETFFQKQEKVSYQRN
jgi:hypothetical protein